MIRIRCPKHLYRPARWDPLRIVSGMLPAVCFVVAWFFWIYFSPPTGPSVPNMAATFGLLVLLAPIRVLDLVPLVLVAMGAFVAPVYFLIMPRLSTGPELLTLIFVFAFTVGTVIVGRLSVLKTLILSMFVMMTGISNDQIYSFTGLVDGAQMMLVGLIIVGIVQAIMQPTKSEQAILNSVRRFFRGCARVTGGYASGSQSDSTRWRTLRKRYFESMILPASAKVQAMNQHLDYERFPDNPPEKVQRLVDAFQSITNRLQALEISYQQCSVHAACLPQSFALVTSQIRESLQSVFERWATLEPCDAMEHQRDNLKQLARDLERQFDALKTSGDRHDVDDRLLADLYTTMGSVQGLVDAMNNTQSAINQINWKQWATPRF